ncbi:tRNA (5-methylaminomethyl-2-thiouridine)(34)-methyltransferase MnmD [Dinoroseobacter sp. S124A]|uniref:tRNA (5-methylaminomethyl-2-thiouridine)(34)-methyltransferase MnmD n=1 Tax=Dinoroseobacter sp. S124A TaxID=3415128 RepID=UPI003C7BC213
MQSQQADVAWTDGVPVSVRFDDPYYSKADGLAETRHVFVAGNALPARFRPGFAVAELGFGTGLTLAVMRMAWGALKGAGPLRFTSFEAFPMPVPEMRAALSAFPGVTEVLEDVLSALEGGATTFEAADLRFELVLGDARETLPKWEGRADAWCLDGFSPAKNPELWDPDLMAQVARHTAPGGSFATYTAAGHVRRALAAAGFEVTRIPGFGRKRHMSVGRLP